MPAVERVSSSHPQPTQSKRGSVDVHLCLVQLSVGVVLKMKLIAGKKPATTKSLILNLEQCQTKEILIANGTRAACSEECRIEERGGKR